MSDARAAGAIYDIGYQHYDGPRLGRANAVRTLIVFSFAAAFGVGRGQKAQGMPILIVIVVFAAAFMQVVLAGVSGRPEAINYAQHLQFVAFFLALFAASQAPELIVTDRQYGVLPLYLSRSLRSTDYALAKLAAFAGALVVLTLGPELTLFVSKQLLSETPWQALRGDWKTLGPIIGGPVLAACYMATVGLALASLALRRSYASASVIAFFVITPALSGIASQLLRGDARQYAVLANPFAVITGFAAWLFSVQAGATRRPRMMVRADLPGHLYLYVMLATCSVALAVLLVRYRKAEE